MITSESLEFSSDDCARWAAFLATPTGQRLLPKVAEGAPRLLSGGDTNEILIRNGELLGFQAAIQALLELQHPPQITPASADAYPPLDDDTQWPNHLM